MVGEGIYFEEIRDRLHSNINGVLWITKTWIHKQNSFRTVTLVLHLKRWAWDAIFKVVKLEGHRKHRRTICPSTQTEVKSTGTSIPIDNSQLHQALNQRIILITIYIFYPLLYCRYAIFKQIILEWGRHLTLKLFLFFLLLFFGGRGGGGVTRITEMTFIFIFHDKYR